MLTLGLASAARLVLLDIARRRPCHVLGYGSRRHTARARPGTRRFPNLSLMFMAMMPRDRRVTPAWISGGLGIGAQYNTQVLPHGGLDDLAHRGLSGPALELPESDVVPRAVPPPVWSTFPPVPPVPSLMNTVAVDALVTAPALSQPATSTISLDITLRELLAAAITRLG